MSLAEHDVVIVGAGHNGLACAAYLARAGLDVEVLERRGVVGGAAVTEEPWPGYRVSSASYVVSLMPQRVVDEWFEDERVMAVPGRNASTVVLKDLRRGRRIVRIRDLVTDR